MKVSFPVLWALWLAAFCVIEAAAFVFVGSRGTLSWQVWELRAGPVRFFMWPLLAWLVWHFVLEPVRLYTSWADDVATLAAGLLAAALTLYRDPDDERGSGRGRNAGDDQNGASAE